MPTRSEKLTPLTSDTEWVAEQIEQIHALATEALEILKGERDHELKAEERYILAGRVGAAQTCVRHAQIHLESIRGGQS